MLVYQASAWEFYGLTVLALVAFAVFAAKGR